MAESAAVSFGGGFAGVAGSSHGAGQGASVVAGFARQIGSLGGETASCDEEESTRHVADETTARLPAAPTVPIGGPALVVTCPPASTQPEPDAGGVVVHGRR